MGEGTRIARSEPRHACVERASGMAFSDTFAVTGQVWGKLPCVHVTARRFVLCDLPVWAFVQVLAVTGDTGLFNKAY